MEQLIRDLNSPQNQGRPDAINSIQRQIQSLQRHPSAWQMGLNLLKSDEQVLQFYGALTLGLKVNADWDADHVGLDRDSISELVQALASSYARLSAVSSGSDLAVNKLSTVLAAVFAKPNAAWGHPCSHVLACMIAGRYIPGPEAPSMVQILATDASVSADCLRAVLRLAQALAEENAALAQNKTGHRYDTQLSNNAGDVWQLINFAMTWICQSSQLIDQSTCATGLQVHGVPGNFERILEIICQQVPLWSKYVTLPRTDSSTPIHMFTPTIELLLRVLDRPGSAEFVMPCFTLLQTDYSSLVRRSVPRLSKRVNESAAVRSFTEDLTNEVFAPEAISYLEFLEATLNQHDLTEDKYLQDEDMVSILRTIKELFKIDGAAVVEDEICQILLEVMTSVAEGYSDWVEPSPFDEGMIDLIKDACASTLRKVRYPEAQLSKLTATWEEDDFTKFEDFRFAASDFFQTAFGILGSSLGVDVALSITHDYGSASKERTSISWSDFEAAIFVLTTLSDALSNDSEKCDPCLTLVFQSKFWNDSVNNSEQVPGRVRRAMIRLLGETTTFLQRNPQFLVSSLNFLFKSLQIKTHSTQAAKAIFNLCDSQRNFLVQAIPQFLQTLTTLEHIPLGSRCKVLSGVAALIQALPTESEKVEPLQRMLFLIQNLEATDCTVDIASADEASHPLFERMSMIAALAKGLQSLPDTPIDLDAIESSQATFWTHGDGHVVQEAVIEMLKEPWNHLRSPDSSDLVTAACDFLRAGFKEQHPSPLKFASISSVQLLTSLMTLENPNLDQTMNTASCYVASAPLPSFSLQATSEANELITSVLSITKESITHLRNSDPVVNFTAPTSILDFFIRCMPKYGLHIFTHPSPEEMIDPMITYAILLLQSETDTLPRRSAASFFTSFVDLSDPTAKISINPTSSAVLMLFLTRYMPTILGSVIHLLAGECARSEIETLTETLRRFVLRQPMPTKRIMQEAILPQSGVFTEKALNATKPEQRARFIAQVEGLRGARKTNEVVREFWVTCRGGQFGYIA